MTTRSNSWRWVLVTLSLMACGDDGELSAPDPTSPCEGEGCTGARGDASVDVVPTDDAGALTEECPATQAEPVPMRSSITAATTKLVAASELFDGHFVKQCGGCHAGAASMGNFNVTALTFADQAERCLEYMRHPDKAKVMPKSGPLLSERPEGDPVRTMDQLIDAWLKSGKAELFPDPRASAPGEASPTTGLATPAELGKALTNLGSCTPAARILTSDGAKMDELDALFAAATTLPDKLSQTDLYTLDSKELAKQGVISFAPGYTLWADDAKKMRYVRVPHGQSIGFSVAKQQFEIPDNTRFYKTFLKAVVDKNGQLGYRKIETRIIVVRHSTTPEGQVDAQVNALYGTYAWNAEETEAELVKVPLRNGKPFADVETWYITDEQQAQPIIDKQKSEDPAAKLLKAKPELIARGFARHYEIPGGERCVQCHMGAPDLSFTLGFTPIQIMRRPVGEGGVIEPSGPDELNQLQRLIDYGLITGVASTSKIIPLEKSQAERSPRNDKELIAQGYMLGNCAHCHNPLGYASVSAPVLKDKLDFYPNAHGGGVFEFPLDRVSPRIRRTFSEPTTDGSMPYITPDIFDHSEAQQPAFNEDLVKFPMQYAAPWRSLLYRNVETPFTYSGDGAIYPHMPLNTAGFDCRAPRIMGEWMVSIPARLKGGRGYFAVYFADNTVQPYEEVKRGDVDYAIAQQKAGGRLSIYQNSDRYKSCPETSDVVDRSVDGVTKLVPDPSEHPISVPTRPHWVPLDLTDKDAETWEPRNAGWKGFLVDGVIPPPPANGNCDSVCEEARQVEQQALADILQSVRLTPAFRAFAEREVPFGKWESKPSCDFKAIPKAASLVSASSPLWLKELKPEDPVYMQAPGESVFSMICSNCHGANADSRGRQADTLLLLTGGSTRVANFRAGLFGPVPTPGAGRADVFGPVATSNASVDDWAARYLAWMALGGTTRTIPKAVLNVVGANPVLGQRVERGTTASANMLGVARSVCASILPRRAYGSGFMEWALGERQLPTSTLVAQKNGDAAMWKAICSFDNALPVRVMMGSNWDSDHAPLVRLGVYQRAAYPVGTPVVDHNGKVQTSLTPENAEPWCLQKPENPIQLAAAEQQRVKYGVDGRAIPFCPDSLFEKDAAGVELHRYTESEELQWELRGAVNAGFAVFSYLDQLTKGKVVPKPEYNQCEKLGAAPTP